MTSFAFLFLLVISSCDVYFSFVVSAELFGSSIPKGQRTKFEAPTQKQCFHQVFNALGTAGNRAKVRFGHACSPRVVSASRDGRRSIEISWLTPSTAWASLCLGRCSLPWRKPHAFMRMVNGTSATVYFELPPFLLCCVRIHDRTVCTSHPPNVKCLYICHTPLHGAPHLTLLLHPPCTASHLPNPHCSRSLSSAALSSSTRR